MGVIIREYVPGDEEGIVDLVQSAFGDWPTADIQCSRLDYWRWKYLGNPYSEKGVMVVVAVDDDEIIGVCSMNVLPFKLAGTQTLCTYAGDHAVKEEYRGQGISTSLISENRVIRDAAGIKYTYFVTQNPILIQSYNKRYHVFPLPIINMVRIIDIDLQLQNMPMEYEWLMKTGYKALQLANKLKYPVPKHEKSDIVLKRVRKFPQNIENLLKQNQKIKFMVNNKREYLNWRYCDPRAGPYNILLARYDGDPVGYLVTRINRYFKDYPIAYIVDLLTVLGNRDIASLLLESALSELDDQGVNIVLSMTPKGHPYEQVYSSQGFVDSRKNLHLYTSLNQHNEEYLLVNIQPSEAQFNYGAIDSVPISIPRH